MDSVKSPRISSVIRHSLVNQVRLLQKSTLRRPVIIAKPGFERLTFRLSKKQRAPSSSLTQIFIETVEPSLKIVVLRLSLAQQDLLTPACIPHQFAGVMYRSSEIHKPRLFTVSQRPLTQISMLRQFAVVKEAGSNIRITRPSTGNQQPICTTQQWTDTKEQGSDIHTTHLSTGTQQPLTQICITQRWTEIKEQGSDIHTTHRSTVNLQALRQISTPMVIQGTNSQIRIPCLFSANEGPVPRTPTPMDIQEPPSQTPIKCSSRVNKQPLLPTDTPHLSMAIWNPDSQRFKSRLLVA